MSVLDTFYIMFKTNADDVKRGMDTINKVTKDTEEKLKATNEQAATLGSTFVKMVTGGAELAGMASAFSIVKAGVMSQRDYNNELRNTSVLYNQNVSHLKAYAAMASETSGKAEDRQGAIGGLTALLSANPWAKGDPWEIMAARRKMYQAASNKNALLTGPQAFYQTEGERLMLQMSDEEFRAKQKSTGVTAAGNFTSKDAEAAHENAVAGMDLQDSMDKLNTTLGTWVFDHIDGLIGALSKMTSVMGDSVVTALYAVVAAIGLKGLASGGLFGGLAKSILKGGVTAELGETSVAAIAGAGIASASAIGSGLLAVLGPALGVLAGEKIAEYAAPLYTDTNDNSTPKLREYIAKKRTLASSVTGSKDDMAFWMSQGYSKEGAAGWLAQMQAESAGDPNAVGDNGAAKGLFQWHRERRDAIMKATGIDVWNSSKADQMKAAAFEAKGMGIDKSIAGMNSYQSGSYLSSHYEVANGKFGKATEADIRGRSAMQIAAAYQGTTNVGTANVTIGAVNIDAPGADSKQIAQHIKSATQDALSTVQAHVANGSKGS